MSEIAIAPTLLVQPEAEAHPSALKDEVFYVDHDGEPDLSFYDRFIVFFSGGKDSLACVLHLLELGVPASKIELHHHLVDGAAEDGPGLMDWPVTLDYCRKFAMHIGASFQTSYREGGIEREMLRDNQRTAPVVFYKNGERFEIGGVNGPLNTRLKFPQQSASLSTRWCSAAAKIDVSVSYLRNVEAFRNSRTLVVTGERAEESSARAKYATFERHRADNRSGKSGRFIDHWRAVHSWSERRVWDIIERHSIEVHVAYRLGYGRTSCQRCIFGSRDQWATNRAISPVEFQRIADHESAFGVTIHRTMSVIEQADLGTPYAAAIDPANAHWVKVAMSTTFDLPMVVNWTLPAGAFGENCGPT
jgi:3'-phosphoadenosine 5'-phosphosulfate sulfotransferase (PAPS reductase)/FAD synthetase